MNGLDRTRELVHLSRATIVSIAATGLEFVILPFWVHVVPNWVAFATVQLVANLVTFLLYKYWAFDAAHIGSLGRQYAKQMLVFGGSWALNTAVPSLLTYRAHLGPVVSFAISNVFVYALWNYPLNRWWVFHHQEA
jgi:putative flippase GtrA